jgi:transposase InsO family protein
MDFFVVPTVMFRVVYVWFAINHARRRILHFDVTNAPTAAWVVQQLRETFGLDVMPRHLIFDRDSIFSAQVVSTVKSFGNAPTRTAYRSPWQNGVAERWVGSVRRELLDQSSFAMHTICGGCSASTSPTITTTARILGSTRRPRPGGHARKRLLQALPSWCDRAWADCTIATNSPPSTLDDDRLARFGADVNFARPSGKDR